MLNLTLNSANRVVQLTLAVFAASALAACSIAPQRPTPAALARTPRLIVISLDGLRPEFYRAGSGWIAPTLQKLAAQGASADSAEPVYPTLTYPNHATLITGARSAKHGVVSNTVFSTETGPTALWYWDHDHIKAPTLWERARAAGITTAVLTWPGTVGATADWLIPEIFPSPPALVGQTWDLMRERMSPRWADELVAANSGATPEGFGPRDEWISRAVDHVLRRERPEFALIHLINVDRAEHETGKDSTDTHAALTVADSQLERMLSSIDPTHTTVVVLGDHGFYDYDKVIRPNVLFAEQGWLKPGGEWQVIAHAAGGAAAVYARDAAKGPEIVKLLKKKAGRAYRVIERAELDRLEAFPGAICAIDPSTQGAKANEPGYSVSVETKGAWIETTGKLRGNHGPLGTGGVGRAALMTGLVAVGPGIPAGKKLGNIRLLDVAPTLAKLLGVPLSEAEGQPIGLHGTP